MAKKNPYEFTDLIHAFSEVSMHVNYCNHVEIDFSIILSILNVEIWTKTFVCPVKSVS